MGRLPTKVRARTPARHLPARALPLQAPLVQRLREMHQAQLVQPPGQVVVPLLRVASERSELSLRVACAGYTTGRQSEEKAEEKVDVRQVRDGRG